MSINNREIRPSNLITESITISEVIVNEHLTNTLNEFVKTFDQTTWHNEKITR